MPYSVLIDRSGKIRYIHKGYKPGDEVRYVNVLKGLTCSIRSDPARRSCVTPGQLQAAGRVVGLPRTTQEFRMPLNITKDSIDIGIVTADAEAMLKFYRDTLGLEFEGEMQMGTGTMHRLSAGPQW